MNYADLRLPERFWMKIRIDDRGCWCWTGSAAKGYGQFNWKCADGVRRLVSTHRLTVSLDREIPIGMTIDHLCFNTRCCNPAHLDIVTMEENRRRFLLSRGFNISKVASKAARTATGKFGWIPRTSIFCSRGHMRVGANLKVSCCYGRLKFRCRECERAADRALYAKQNSSATTQAPEAACPSS